MFSRRRNVGLVVVFCALWSSGCSKVVISEPLTAARTAVGARPYGLTISASGVVYTSQLDGASVTRLRVGDATPLGVVNVGETPTDVTFDPSGSLAFVTNQFDPSVGVIDVASGRQTQVIPAAATTFRVIVAPNGQRAYATESDGRLLVIDVSSRALVGSIPIPRAANGLAFGAGDTLLYVTSMQGELALVNLRANAVVRSWTVGGTLQEVVASPDRGTLYLAREGPGEIDVVNAASGTVSSRFSVGQAGLFGLALAPDGRSLYATQPSAGQVVVVDRTNGGISRTFSVGGMPRRIVFDRNGGRAIVSNEAGWVDYLP